ncbi:MAG: bifunctional phosphoribosylaminoimidazolecarboxamide formyltransferase/IMP cyclohydrolase, partial [Gammaproteobacteria bacterium]|nr:bifunctional phosphoribosylaminoimidazolecarboxamide formyltransferase/IMP cyclohydrolase [Gammaproteobacteria bacterium]
MSAARSRPPPVARALLSVSDKTGVVAFARGLQAAGVKILSTGGTARALREGGVEVRDVSAYTGFPEIMGGRVKTLHPRIHGGLLARRGEDDAVMREHGIAGIDLLAVNLYPFERTVARGARLAEAVENIDIGGPAMVRAAAKNHRFVTVVTNPADYDEVLGLIRADGGVGDTRRLELAAAAFSHIAAYDRAVAAWLARRRATMPKTADAAPQTADTAPQA